MKKFVVVAFTLLFVGGFSFANADSLLENVGIEIVSSDCDKCGKEGKGKKECTTEEKKACCKGGAEGKSCKGKSETKEAKETKPEEKKK